MATNHVSIPSSPTQQIIPGFESAVLEKTVSEHPATPLHWQHCNNHWCSQFAQLEKQLRLKAMEEAISIVRRAIPIATGQNYEARQKNFRIREYIRKQIEQLCGDAQCETCEDFLPVTQLRKYNGMRLCKGCADAARMQDANPSDKPETDYLAGLGL